MLVAWRQRWNKQREEQRATALQATLPARAGLKMAVLMGVFWAALLVTGLGTWRPAHGQESPLATPPPAEAPPVEAPPATFVPTTLPSINGVVRDQSGDPLAGIVVVAYRRQQNSWSTARQTTTDAVGGYRFPWMTAGTYRLLMRDPQGVYASTYYPASGDIEDATDVVVVGSPLSGVDATISAGGRITGTLSWPNGPDPFDSLVRLYYVTAAPITTRLNVNDDMSLPAELRQVRLLATKSFTESVANFEFTGLAAGSYRVCAEGVALHENIYECFDDATLGIHGTDVVVAQGATVANVAIAFGDGADLATLMGAVTLPDQSPAAGVDVEVISAPNLDYFISPQPHRTTTDAAGMFLFDDLPFGRYVVRFADAEGLYLPSDYRATAEESAATVVALERSSEVTISAVISPASLITGSVIIDGAIAGMGGQVTAFRLGDEGWLAGNTGNIIAATGAYTVAGLRGGNYRLQYTVDIPSSIFYGEPGATLETATDIAVMTGTSVGNIVMDLTPYIAGVAYGSISGQVLLDNVPQAGVAIRIFDAGGDCCVAPAPLVTTVTDAEGRYSVAGLSPGRYKVGVGMTEPQRLPLYAPDQRTFETATIYVIGNPVDGVARQSIADVNVALGPVGSVARRVLRPDDTPVVGTTVNLYQRLGDAGNWPLVAATVTNEEGQYAFAGVIPDVYQICLMAEGLAEPTCGGRGGQGFGLDVVVTAGQDATGIDILSVP